MTYTAARMKQEMAKEGILPFAKFFAQNTDLSIGRLLAWLRARGRFVALLKHRWLSPEYHAERTPVGALCLHFTFCIVLILATLRLSPNDAYTLMTTLTTYVVNCFFGALLAIGILALRFHGPPPTTAVESEDAAVDETVLSEQQQRQQQRPMSPLPLPPPTWRDYAGRRFPHWLSIGCATLFALVNVYPVVVLWVPPTGQYIATAPLTNHWYVVPLVAWCVLGLGALWWLGFLVVAWRQERRGHRVFVIERKPEFGVAGPGDAEGRKGDDGYVLVHETVYLAWVGKETVDGGVRHRTPAGLAGTDFANSKTWRDGQK